MPFKQVLLSSTNYQKSRGCLISLPLVAPPPDLAVEQPQEHILHWLLPQMLSQKVLLRQHLLA
jgi:hypothetical protein